MGVNLCFLAGKAFTCPLIDVSGHVGPNKTGGNEPAGGFDSRMAKGVQMQKNLFAMCLRDQWADGGCGDVSQ